MHIFDWDSAPQTVCLISHTEGFGSPDTIIRFACRVMYRDKSWQVTTKTKHSVTIVNPLTVSKRCTGFLSNH